MFPTLRGRILFLFSIALVILATSSVGPFHTTKVKAQTSPNCQSCAQEGDRVIYAPTIDMPGTASSDIVLNCRSVHEMHAIPTFYTSDGQAIIGNEIVLQPSEMRFVPVLSLIPLDQREHHWGGMSISYYGKLREVWAQITTYGKGHHGSSDVLFNVIDGKGASVQDAVWFTPSRGKSIIALGNSSSSPIHTTAEFPDETVEKDIPANGTEYIRRNANGSSSDYVHLTTNGPDGSLKAVGYVTENYSSYVSMIRFYETPTVVQPNLYATDLKVKNTATTMFLRNTSDSPVTATIKFYPVEGSGELFEMAPVVLNGTETKEIDLSTLHTAARSRNDLDDVSVRVMNSGPNGSLIGALYSVNNANGLVGDVPLRDSGQYSNSTGAYPWRLDNDYKTKVVLNNTGDEATDFTGAIAFNGGEYYLKKQEIKAGESIVFDIQKIRDEQIKDFKGNVIPLNASIGQFRWGLASAKPGVSHLVGRSEVTSPSGHVSISYSCPGDCPMNGPFFDEWPVGYSSPTGMMTPYGVAPYYADYYGNHYSTNLNELQSLTTANSGVGTIAASGDYADIDLTGVSTGATSWDAQYWYSSWEWEPDYGCVGGYTLIDTGGDVSVVSITITKVDGSALPSPFRIGVNGGGHDRTQHLKATVSPDNVPLTSVNITVSSKLTGSVTQRSGRVVSFDVVGKDAASQSSAPGDLSITASVGTVPITTKSVSVVVPSAVATPHDTMGTYYEKNLVADSSTRPPVPESDPNKVHLITVYARDLAITVKDQFGDPIGDIYAGATVTETVGSAQVNINSPLSSSSTYIDAVGEFRESGASPVTRGSQAALDWPTNALIPMLSFPPPNDPQNIAVQIDGFALNPAIVNRLVTPTPPHTVTITW